MIRLVEQSGKWYGIELKYQDNLEEDIENIVTFVEEGAPVIIIEDIESAAELLNCDPDDIEMA